MMGRRFTHQNYTCDAGHKSRILVEDSEAFDERKCLRCGAPTRLSFLSKGREHAKPFVYYVKPNGELFIPADDKTKPGKEYGPMERREATTSGDRKAVLSQLNASDRRKYEAQEAKKNQLREQRVREANETIDRLMPHFSEGGRELLRYARERINQPRYARNYHAGNHFTAYDR